MPNVESESTRPWTMTFQVAREPRCPGCCELLRDVVISFAEGWAWCPTCVGHALHAEPHLRYVLEHDVMAKASILSHGLRFYVPLRTDDGYKNAIDMYEWLLAQPEEDPPPIPQWPGFPPEQLRENYRQAVAAQRVPWSFPISVPPGFFVAGLTADDRVVLVQEKPTLFPR